MGVKRIIGFTSPSNRVDMENFMDIIRKMNTSEGFNGTLVADLSDLESLYILEIDDEKDKIRTISLTKNGVEVLDYLPETVSGGWKDVESEH